MLFHFLRRSISVLSPHLSMLCTGASYVEKKNISHTQRSMRETTVQSRLAMHVNNEITRLVVSIANGYFDNFNYTIVEII